MKKKVIIFMVIFIFVLSFSTSVYGQFNFGGSFGGGNDFSSFGDFGSFSGNSLGGNNFGGFGGFMGGNSGGFGMSGNQTATPENEDPTAIRIMPLGDSITDGLTVAGGYRIKLWELIKDTGVKVNFVGSMANGPSSLGDRNHEGHSGWRIDQLDAKINDWMETSTPQIVMLHIGTNDIAQGYSVSQAPDRLGKLIDKICDKLPSNGKLFVSNLIPLTMTSVNGYNKEVERVVKEKASQGKPIVFVEMYSKLTTSDLADGVHANRGGYDKMADAWFEAIKDDLEVANTTEQVSEPETQVTESNTQDFAE
jgi:lysophospholipase L1-like esterase